MSEYWVSRKKYFCTYCEIYIADDAPSRRQHESGLRHKGNRERFVRNVFKQSERKIKDRKEGERELERIEQAANAAFAQDISSGHATAASTSRLPASAPAASSSKKPERPGSVWSNYTTAQSLGYTDPEEERMKAEMALRQTQGTVGEWQVVAPPPPPLPEEESEAKDVEDGTLSSSDPSSSRKREAPLILDDEDDARHFKLRKRTLGAGLDEIWDPGEIQVKPRSKPKEESSMPEVNTAGSPPLTADGSGTLRVPDSSTEERSRWRPLRWNRASGDLTKDEINHQVEADQIKEFSAKKEPDTAPDKEPAIQASGFGLKENHEVEADQGEETKIPIPLKSEPPPALFKKRGTPARLRGRR